MPATPVLSNGGTGRGLPISCYLNSVPDSLEGHRRHLERECLAGRARRRHRHLLGQCPRHRRGGRPQRQDQRHHPVRAGDGFADAGDQPGLAAPRLGRLLSRHLAPRDRGVPRDPQALGRLQPQGAQPPPRRARHRRLHGGGARRRANGCCRARRTARSAARVDARSLFQKLVETRLATGEPYIIFIDQVNRSMPKHHRDLGLKVTTSNLCSRDHPADRHATISAPERTAVCCLSSLNLETWDEWNGDKMLHRGRDALPRQRAAPTISSARPTRWRGPSTAPSASAASASA